MRTTRPRGIRITCIAELSGSKVLGARALGQLADGDGVVHVLRVEALEGGLRDLSEVGLAHGEAVEIPPDRLDEAVLELDAAREEVVVVDGEGHLVERGAELGREPLANGLEVVGLAVAERASGVDHVFAGGVHRHAHREHHVGAQAVAAPERASATPLQHELFRGESHDFVRLKGQDEPTAERDPRLSAGRVHDERLTRARVHEGEPKDDHEPHEHDEHYPQGYPEDDERHEATVP